MKVLLDTHTFLWWAIEPEKLSPKVFEILENPKNQILLSAASSWEAEIKIGINKLVLNKPLKQIIMKEVEVNNWIILPISLEHTWKLEALQPIHRDPFDRILIAQALSENAALLSKDSKFLKYNDIEIIWD